MTTEQRVTARDIGNQLEDGIVAIFRWLALVAAIAVGTALGLYLFFKVLSIEMRHDMQDVFNQFTTTTTTTPSYSP